MVYYFSIVVSVQPLPPPRLVILLVAGVSNFVMMYIVINKVQVQVQVLFQPINLTMLVIIQILC